MVFSPITTKTDLLSNGLIVLLIIALGLTHCYEDISISNVIKFTWFFSLICSVCAIIVIRLGLNVYYNSLSFEGSGDDLIYDDLTAAQGGILNIYAALFLFPRRTKKWEFLILTVGIIVSLYSILLTQKRTPFIVILFVFFYFMYTKKLLGTLLKPQNVVLLIILFIFFAFSASDFFELLENVQGRSLSGLSDLVFGVDSYDNHNSTAIRYYTRQEAFDRIDRFSLWETIFGAGYKTKYLDMPLLQSYQDLGILGFCLFSYFQFIFPLSILKHPKLMSDELMWASFMVCYGMLGCLTTGHPYIINKWLPILVLSMIYIGDQKYSDYTYNIYERID